MVEIVLGVLVACAVAVILWQHFRDLGIRRRIIEDRQPILYSASAFHTLTFVRVGAGQSALEELRKHKELIAARTEATIVYAGLGIPIVRSKQIASDWDALMFVQYPSRGAFEALAADDEYRQLLAGWDDTYTQGVQRPVFSNLIAPIALLGMRISDILRRVPSAFPFVPADPATTPGITQTEARFAELRPFREINQNAVVVFNLVLEGDREQQHANDSYRRSMMGAMAEGGYGPIHNGKPVTLSGSADFDRFQAMYYPGVDFMLDMVVSTFFNRISGNKQLQDTLAVATVPVLSKL